MEIKRLIIYAEESIYEQMKWRDYEEEESGFVIEKDEEEQAKGSEMIFDRRKEDTETKIEMI